MAHSASSAQIEKKEILALLSDSEIGKVSMAEMKKSIAPGEQFVDLDDLRAGVQMVQGTGAPDTHDLIVRSAVGTETWSNIVKRLRAG